MNIVALLDDPGITPALPNDLLAARLQATGHPCKTIRCNQLASLVPRGGSTRISHKLRRETPREAGWDKAGAESGEGCMRTYCPNHDSSPTLSQPASRKSQQMACERCGLGFRLFFGGEDRDIGGFSTDDLLGLFQGAAG